jgi:thiol-disulfide isomerase/thioredoxin
VRRRHLLAGLASAGALGGAGLVATGNVPAVLGGSSKEPVEPLTIETIEAPGSRDGEVTLPATDRPTFIDFFATWCDPCEAQMPALAEAHDRVGDEVLFVSVTWEGLSEAEIVEWWERNGGGWTLARDPTAEVTAVYNTSEIPYAVAIDETGIVRWSESGQKTVDELVAGIEQAL